jgi:hypothetical protein
MARLVALQGESLTIDILEDIVRTVGGDDVDMDKLFERQGFEQANIDCLDVAVSAFHSLCPCVASVCMMRNSVDLFVEMCSTCKAFPVSPVLWHMSFFSRHALRWRFSS